MQNNRAGKRGWRMRRSHVAQAYGPMYRGGLIARVNSIYMRDVATGVGVGLT